MTPCSRLATSTALSLLMSLGLAAGTANAQNIDDTVEDTGVLDEIVVSAEEQTKQALGVSNISAEDLERTPVVNDISEIVRKMPGVNLTGNTTTGQRGNNRQIDIRGMGPENTLILIDGKPVNARNSVRMGRMGERDTRGDSNWVAPELIERIEVLRGPAAARYGSGASGGVVNIITKRPTEAMGSVSVRYNAPQHGDEGDTKRVNLMYAMPLSDTLTARFNANWNRTEPDAQDINKEAALAAGETASSIPAGREGVVNKDVNALLSWAPRDGQKLDFEFGYSRQGNLYAGDSQLSNSSANATIQSLYGEETNVMRRQVFGVTHEGEYAFGKSFSYLQMERTRNTRLPEGSAGSVEGQINNLTDFKTIKLDNLAGKSEWSLPGVIGGKRQTLTFGADFRYETMEDSVSNSATVPGTIPGTETNVANRDASTDQTLIGLYAESNIAWSDALILTPALRLDHGDTFGDNISPSLNATYHFNDNWQAKAGIARAFKAPNLYQLNPNYVYTSMGNGCTNSYNSATTAKQCYVVGNPDLKPETSVNTEIGLAYDSLNGTTATITAFHNDFRNYIMGGLTEVGTFVNTSGTLNRYYKWENVPRAKISGLEASFAHELREDLRFAVNATYMIQSKNETTGDPLSLIPKYTINASVDWMVTEQFTVTPSASFYGKTEARTYSWNTDSDVTTDADLEPRDPYAIANINLRYDFQNGAVLIGGITNVFDERLERTGNGANTYNEPGRAFYIGLTKTF
ncbi:MAG TPA: FepA family TonB-dependent siderophore receptor [Paenirhodobacter sp.]